MPAKNAIKLYIENGSYHIYNRGVDKREIFSDDQDYGVFLSYLKEYLSPRDTAELSKKLTFAHLLPAERATISKELRMKNFHQKITLLAYCLMPNHFHLLLRQTDAGMINQFLQSVSTRYSMYYNKKHGRTGHLFQGCYKAVSIEGGPVFLYLSRYIHRQALELGEKQPSSFGEFIGLRKTAWVQPQEILDHFAHTYAMSYAQYVMEEDTLALTDYMIEE